MRFNWLYFLNFQILVIIFLFLPMIPISLSTPLQELGTFNRVEVVLGNDSLKASQGQLNEINKALKSAREARNKLLKKTNTLDVDIKDLSQRLVIGASLIQDHERWVNQLEEELVSLNITLVNKKKNLKLRRKRNGQMLLGLYRVSQYPPEALIVRPGSPGDAIRSAILLRTSVGVFQREVLSLRRDVSMLWDAKRKAKQRSLDLSLVKAELQHQRKVMRILMGRKKRLRRRTLTKSNKSKRRLQSLVRQAESMQDFILRLEKTRIKRRTALSNQAAAHATENNLNKNKNIIKQKLKSMNGAKGKLLLPVVGRMISKYGDKGESGSTHKGLTIMTGLGAQVVAPYDGRVAFAGVFRGYGNLLIIEHSQGYHTLISGMKKIDSVLGQWLLAGEPIGKMVSLGDSKEKTHPLLYLEIRYKGQPINPLPWLVVRNIKLDKDKVNG